MRNNTGAEDVPGIDQPGTPALPGFDIGWAPAFAGRIQPAIRQAETIRDEFLDRVTKPQWEAVGRSLALKDELSGKSVNQITAPVLAAAQVADEFSGRIADQIMTPIVTISEASRKWGVYPSPPDGQTMPGDVMEARALLQVPGMDVPPGPNGTTWVVSPEDYTQLLLWVQAHCLPLRSVNFAQYVECIKQAEARFPPGSSFFRQFSSDLMKMENEYQPPAGMPIIGSQTSLPVVPDSVTSPAGVSQVPLAQALPVTGDPGGFFGGGGIQCPPDGVRDTRPPELKNDPNRPRVGSPGVGFSSPDAAEFFRGWPTRSVGPAGETVWTCPIGSSLKYRPNDPAVQCIEPGIAACYGPQALADVPGGQLPGFPIPGPGEGEPGPEVPCVKICGLDELIEALKPSKEKPADCGKWKAYRDVITGECYVIKSTDKPRHSDDKLLIESADAAAIVAAVNKECGPKSEKRPEARPEAPLAFGRGPVGCDWILPPINAEIANWPNPIGWLTGVTGQDGKAPPVAGDSILGTVGGAVARFIRETVSYGFENVWKAIRGFVAGDPCFGGAQTQLAGTRTIANLLHNWFGAAIEPAMVTLQNQQNFLCPTAMPSPTEAATAYLGNTINEDTARCWIRAAGMQDRLYDRVIRASRAKLNPTQLVALARRGVIQEADLPERLRDLGYIDPSDAGELWELGKALPGPADVVRFMVRDVDDPQIVGQFGLDDEFGAKFAGLTRGYAQAAGIDEDLMRRYWRSHWSIPGPSQLLEMYHRLRNHPDAQGKRVDLDTVKTALQQQDILPYWIPRLLETSFRPLRLVDVRRAFFDGSIGLPEVRQSYEDGGYSDTNADILTRHLLKQKILSLQNHKAVRAYAAGMINAAELTVELSELGYDRDQIQYAVDLARHKMSQAKRKACASGVKKRLMRGEFDAQRGREQLIALGLDVDQAAWLADGWACERASRGKEFSAAQLCKMYDRGLISGPEMIVRLEQVGWSRDDAVRLFTICAQDVDRARRMADIKAAREREKELEKAKRQAEKDQKKIETAMNQEAQRKSRIDRLNKARNKAVVDAGALWAKAQSLDLSDAIAQAKAVYRTVYNSTTATQDVIIGSLLSSVKSKQVDTLAKWIAEATTIAETGVFDDPNQPPVE